MYRDIPDEAVQAGKVATAYLARALRDNDLWLDNARASVAAQLNASSGHVHANKTRDFSYNFDDRIEVVSGRNDQISFIFGGGSYAAATHTVTLTPGLRTPTAHAAHVQSKMRTAVDPGSPSSVPISVTYDVATGSETRGMFYLQHTGSSDSLNARLFQLPLGTGASYARSAAQAMGLRRRDYKGGRGYRGNSGFADSFVQDTLSLGDGDLLDATSFQNSAFTTPKFKNGVVPSGAFQANSIAGGSGGEIASGAVTGPKMGATEEAAFSVGANDTATHDIDIANGGASRRPNFSIHALGGAEPGALSIVSISKIAGGSGHRWRVTAANATAGSLTAHIAGY